MSAKKVPASTSSASASGKTTVLLTAAEKLRLIEWLAEKARQCESMIATSRKAVKISKTEYTLKQLAYHENVRAAIKWLIALAEQTRTVK